MCSNVLKKINNVSVSQYSCEIKETILKMYKNKPRIIIDFIDFLKKQKQIL